MSFDGVILEGIGKSEAMKSKVFLMTPIHVM